MKKIYILLFAIMVSACSSMHTNVRSANLVEKVESNHSAQISVGNKISGSSSSYILFGIFKIYGDNMFADGVEYDNMSSWHAPRLYVTEVEKAKSAAAYHAVVNSGADVIVAPRYFVKDTNFFYILRSINASVTGYKGTINGFYQKR
ncbi:MAG: hypothetical protein SO141_01065 [Alphaproteobacteria bacterium]|nr:hypothetical protein [Alphaproteobacteria bacterium]